MTFELLAKCNSVTMSYCHMIRSFWCTVLYKIRLQSKHALEVHDDLLRSKQTKTSSHQVNNILTSDVRLGDNFFSFRDILQARHCLVHFFISTKFATSRCRNNMEGIYNQRFRVLLHLTLQFNHRCILYVLLIRFSK